MKIFETIERRGKFRRGRLRTKSGDIQTPFFMPIATKGAVKNVTPEELEDLNAQIILANAYHLWLRPGHKLIEKAGSLHEFMNWKGPILTDSGGFQVFSLGAKAEKKFGKKGVKITKKGVYFIDPVDGKKHFMSPEKSIEVQLALGSDIIMVLDECPPYPCTYEQAKLSMERTIEWAARCKKYFNEEITNYQLPISNKIQNSNEKNTPNAKYQIPNTRSLLFGIVQGSVYKDLRERCAKELMAIGFDGYAIGGVAVGEPREKMKEVLDWVVPLLPEDKPRYLMGLGRPEELVWAVDNGIDMFDCVIPTREGRHGKIFIMRHRDLSKPDFYETITITKETYKNDFSPLSENSDCYICKNYSKAYLRYLFSVKEPLALRLASLHNLKFYLDLMKMLRERREMK